MPEFDDTALERRLRAVLKEHLGALPLDLTVEALDRRREAKGARRRSGRGRGITLLAAAALLLAGGVLAAGSGLLRLPTVVPPVPESSVIAVATASPDATSLSPSESAEPSASPIPVAGPGGVWIPTGSMVTTRYYPPRAGGGSRAPHTAVRLLDGRVLVVGGRSASGDDLTSAELYDPATGTWSATGDMLRPYVGPRPTLLRDGRVLAGAEVYDPATETWSATGRSRGEGIPTLLRDGRVLMTSNDGAELYDPDSGTWTVTGKMIDPRHSHTAILLLDGKVLVAGGHAPGDEPTDSAELYDPDSGSWTAIANMHAKRDSIESFLQPDGKVLVLGASQGGPWSTELYDPATGAWTELAGPTESGSPRALSPRALLSDGSVLMTDLRDASAEPDSPQPPCTAAALYNPRTGSLTTASSMLACDVGSTFTFLLDGTILKAGRSECNGDGMCVTTGAAELYVPAGVSPPPLPAFPSAPTPAFPSPTPRPTPLPPAVGPVPPNARAWKVTVDNKSSEPATLFVAEEDEGGMLRLVGSATPNVVPAGATVKVTFLFPAKAAGDGWIYVNPRPGEGGSLVNADQIGIRGKIMIGAEGDAGWLSP